MGCEAHAHRLIGVSSVLRLTDEVPKRAALNPGRYDIAASFELPNAELSDAALDQGQAALNVLRRRNRLFIHRLPRVAQTLALKLLRLKIGVSSRLYAVSRRGRRHAHRHARQHRTTRH